jgi:hypothetical protein
VGPSPALSLVRISIFFAKEKDECLCFCNSSATRNQKGKDVELRLTSDQRLVNGENKTNPPTHIHYYTAKHSGIIFHWSHTKQVVLCIQQIVMVCSPLEGRVKIKGNCTKSQTDVGS